MYEKIFYEVKDYLRRHNADDDDRFTFRKRSGHIWRVYTWAKRLMEDCVEEINSEALLTAALFHDIGYVKGVDDHASHSADIFRDYAERKGYDKTQADFIEYLIRNHSDRELLYSPDTPLEFILFKEADILDEAGALGVVWFAMAAGSRGAEDYEGAYREYLSYARKILDNNPMKTAKAREIWERKQDFIREFFAQLECDLAIDEK